MPVNPDSLVQRNRRNTPPGQARAILQGLAEGRTQAEIAAKLGVNADCVYNYVRYRCHREHVRGPIGLVVKAIRSGHLDLNKLNVTVE